MEIRATIEDARVMLLGLGNVRQSLLARRSRPFDISKTLFIGDGKERSLHVLSRRVEAD